HLHHFDPAVGPAFPRGVVAGAAWTGKARVPLLDAPIRVDEKLGSADAGDAEDGDGGGESLAGQLELESFGDARPVEILRAAKEYEGARERNEGEEGGFEGGKFLDALVAAAEQEQDGEGREDYYPDVDG